MAAPGKKTIRVTNEGKTYEIEVNENNNENDTELLQPTDEEQFRWNKRATVLLIKTRVAMDSEFLDPLVKKAHLWERISKILKANNFHISGSKCDNKWRNLLQTYRKIKYSKGVDSNWDYFNLIDKANAGKARPRPQKKYLDYQMFRKLGSQKSTNSVSRQNSFFEESSDCEDDDMSFFNFEEYSETGPVTSNRNVASAPHESRDCFQDLSNEPPVWLNSVLEHMNRQDRRVQNREDENWSKLMSAVESLRQAEEEKLTALNKLTGMLEQYLEER